MSRLNVTNFSKRTGSPFKSKESSPETTKIVHEEILQKSHFEKQKEKQNELIQKVTKKTDEYKSNKPSSGVFTEVVTHGAFTSKSPTKEKSPSPVVESVQTKNANGSSSSKSLLGFPSSANDLALDAKTDLESDPNISKEVKEKVIEKLFKLVSMVQHTYESKVRIMTEFEKFKDTHLKNELRREKEHSEQLYKVNMNFQNEVIQAIQRLKSELDITRNVTDNLEQNDINVSKNSSVNFNTDDAQELSDKDTSGDDVDIQNNDEQLIESPTQFDKVVND